jgi:signal transduction histidine kinase
MLGHIRQSSKKLSNIVDEFLTVSRLERGTMALNISINDVAGLVREVVEDCASMCKDKDITIAAELEENLPKVLMDRFYVQRAVANLVQNAIKFTPDGGKVSVCVQRVGGKDNCVTVSVSDTGIGIPADEQDKVFEKYYRSPSAAGTKGSGLGLAVVKAVAVAHSGSVELQSEVGKGSTFSLKLPLTPNALLAT